MTEVEITPTVVMVVPTPAPQVVIDVSVVRAISVPDGSTVVVDSMPVYAVLPQVPEVAVVAGGVAIVGVAQGVPGAQGPPGPPGQYLEFDQASPAAVWIIPHNFGVYPVVRVEDTTGRTLQAAVQDLDHNTVQVTFNAAVAGRAIVQG